MTNLPTNQRLSILFWNWVHDRWALGQVNLTKFRFAYERMVGHSFTAAEMGHRIAGQLPKGGGR